MVFGGGGVSEGGAGGERGRVKVVFGVGRGGGGEREGGLKCS